MGNPLAMAERGRKVEHCHAFFAALSMTMLGHLG